jgi:hypothetical protein
MSQSLIIIPDMHLAHEQAEGILARYRGSTALFLGDYFDDWGDSATAHRHTASWLLWSTQQSGRIHLLGNHDPFYFTGQPCCEVPGSTRQKLMAGAEFLTKKAWEQMKTHYWITSNFLATHAGLTRSQAHPIRPLDEFMAQQEKEFKEACLHNLNHPWLRWGRRAGLAESAGPIWCDWRDFQLIPGLHQIFGHSPLTDKPQWLCRDGTVNIMLDGPVQPKGGAKYPGGYGVYADGRLTIFTKNHRWIKSLKITPPAVSL